jgi:hypothetical protein
VVRHRCGAVQREKKELEERTTSLSAEVATLEEGKTQAKGNYNRLEAKVSELERKSDEDNKKMETLRELCKAAGLILGCEVKQTIQYSTYNATHHLAFHSIASEPKDNPTTSSSSPPPPSSSLGHPTPTDPTPSPTPSSRSSQPPT